MSQNPFFEKWTRLPFKNGCLRILKLLDLNQWAMHCTNPIFQRGARLHQLQPHPLRPGVPVITNSIIQTLKYIWKYVSQGPGTDIRDRRLATVAIRYPWPTPSRNRGWCPETAILLNTRGYSVVVLSIIDGHSYGTSAADINDRSLAYSFIYRMYKMHCFICWPYLTYKSKWFQGLIKPQFYIKILFLNKRRDRVFFKIFI